VGDVAGGGVSAVHTEASGENEVNQSRRCRACCKCQCRAPMIERGSPLPMVVVAIEDVDQVQRTGQNTN